MGTDDLLKKRKAGAQESHKRNTKNLSPKQVILIVYEGEKTEKNYFETLKKQLNLTNANIIIDPDSNPSPSSVVKYAKQKLKQNPNEYDAIYCVFDRDRHRDFNKALNMVKNTIIQTIVSDPCFEFWILLHFNKTKKIFGISGGSPCKEVQEEKAFRKNVKNYAKDYDFKEIITQHLETAINYAKEINSQNEAQRQTPYTQVVVLVEKLRELAGDKKG
ncbi:RloB family protein [Helicobacter apodemus]|uniref:RloB n=1 Tax=Helicobacter apodemus TaxID=135569 RepID=A0A2U8FF19_9HELI|nr:RloB family protein [Helicobacter apodemus]AWI34819.1 RloB [Helicobacter apodemus]